MFAVVRICVSKFCRSSPFYGSRENPKGHANGNGNFRMGLYYFVARKRRGNLLPSFVFASANFAVGSHRPHFCFPVSYIWETATSAWGYITSLRGNDAATCLPSFVFASANFAVVLRFTEFEKIRKGMQTETATSAWGYTLLRYVKRRGNLLPSFVFASANFAVVLRFTKVKSFRKSMQTETATSARGYILLRCAEKTRQLHFYMIKDFSD